MKIVLLYLLVFFSSLFALEDADLNIKVNNSFITKPEYGKMLYNNPRGIGCNTCHGNKASGKKIVTFKHEYKKKIYNCTLDIPSIVYTDYKVFFNKINRKKNMKKKFSKDEICKKLIYKANIMPTYFLVEEEINAIYTYVNTLKKKKKN